MSKNIPPRFVEWAKYWQALDRRWIILEANIVAQSYTLARHRTVTDIAFHPHLVGANRDSSLLVDALLEMVRHSPR
jgi:hypothetical protein